MSNAKTWAKRLDAAEKRGRFTKQDIKLASHWRTCAVGEHRGEFREAGGDGECPLSKVLRVAGQDFVLAIKQDSVALARSAYDIIQAWFSRRKP